MPERAVFRLWSLSDMISSKGWAEYSCWNRSPLDPAPRRINPRNHEILVMLGWGADCQPTLSRSREREGPAPKAREGEGLLKQAALIQLRLTGFAGKASYPSPANGRRNERSCSLHARQPSARKRAERYPSSAMLAPPRHPLSYAPPSPCSTLGDATECARANRPAHAACKKGAWVSRPGRGPRAALTRHDGPAPVGRHAFQCMTDAQQRRCRRVSGANDPRSPFTL